MHRPAGEREVLHRPQRVDAPQRVGRHVAGSQQVGFPAVEVSICAKPRSSGMASTATWTQSSADALPVTRHSQLSKIQIPLDRCLADPPQAIDSCRFRSPSGSLSDLAADHLPRRRRTVSGEA